MKGEFYVREVKRQRFRPVWIVYINGVSTYTHGLWSGLQVTRKRLLRQGYAEVPDPWNHD